MRFSEFNLQSWGYAAGLIAVPFFFLFAYLFSEASGLFAAICVAGCLLMARVRHEILEVPLGAVGLTGCAAIGLAIAALARTQNMYFAAIEGAAFVIAIWMLSKLASSRPKRSGG